MRRNVFKIALLVVLIAVVFAFFLLDLQHYVTLDYIKVQQEVWRDYYQQHRLWVLGVFALIYIAVTALSLPVATVLTLLAGALFGLVVGLVMVSFASTIGATLAFLMARYVARDFIQTKYQKTLAVINQGFEREGAFYLFALRLVPLFPFFMINMLMAIVPIRVRTFYWVSQIGMLPGTAVYVYAGTQLAQIESLSDIVSPSLLFAFALLGLFPLLTKKLLALLRKEKQ